MKSDLKLIYILCFAVLISACTATPYTRYKTPNISGSIYIDQKIAIAIPVYLSINGDDKYCKNFIQKTTTDDNGTFSLTSVKEHMKYTPLMTHYLDEWIICADILNNRKKLYSDNRYGKGSVIQSVNLKCEINSAYAKKEVCLKPLLLE
jgi:hypothetical protein